MKPLKIAMAGPSGVGKTTLAEWISKEYDIPFITTSTKPLWDKHGINTHQELITRTILNPQWGLDFQYELLDIRKNIIESNEQFVTDRSPVDNLVYFLMQNAPYLGEEAVEAYIQLCANALSKITGLVQIPFDSHIPLENDGKRIANKYYQLSTNSQFHLAAQLIEPCLPPKGDLRVVSLRMWDWAERQNAIREFIYHIQTEEIV